jgi:hypothetical protein
MISYHNDFILDMSRDNSERVPNRRDLIVNYMSVNGYIL